MSIYCSFSCYGHKFMKIESMIGTSVLGHCDKTSKNNGRRKDVFASWLQRLGPWSLGLLILGQEWDMTSPSQERVPEGGLLTADRRGQDSSKTQHPNVSLETPSCSEVPPPAVSRTSKIRNSNSELNLHHHMTPVRDILYSNCKNRGVHRGHLMKHHLRIKKSWSITLTHKSNV